jgi:purine-binding chemotaxis protein CheW
MNEVLAPGSAGDKASAPAGAAASIREFLAFKLGREEYGIDILRVQEIRSFEQPTRMVNAPPHVLGVVNLRGVIVPIVDMRLKFGMSEVKYDGFTVVIVLHLAHQIVGMVVDSVSDVISLTPDQMRPAPAFSGAVDGNAVMALGSIAARMLILLDIGRVMDPSTLSEPVA